MTVPLIVLGAGLLMLLVERSVPGREWPQVRGWWLQALAFNVIQVGIVFLAGTAWDGWMVRHRAWSADALGVLPGGLLGYLVITFVYYWWHRWRHSSALLWRWLHQLHHSARRVELITSFYKHPVELLVNGILSSAILYLLVGLSPRAASTAVLMTGLAELFYHWNVRTPYWIGFLIQRPESHCVHHEEGLHSFNYADLPLWDMLFGTFRNPRSWSARCGFGPGSEKKLGDMLRGVEVSEPGPSAPRP